MAHGESAAAAGTLVSISRFLQVPGTLAITFGITRLPWLNIRRTSVVILLLMAVVSVGLFAIDNRPVALVALVIQGFASGALLPLLVSILMDLPDVPMSGVATAAGLFFTVGQVAGAGAPIAVGWLRDASGGFDAGLGFVAVVVLLAVLPALALHDHDTRVRHDSVVLPSKV
jgi:CP family cyanate transporter-like MFS transporter